MLIKHKILIISSRPPQHSAGLGQQLMDALISFGNDVDFLTRYYYQGMPANVLAVTSEPKNWQDKFKQMLSIIGIDGFIKDIKKLIYKIFNIKNKSPYKGKNGFEFKYENEMKPAMPVDSVLEKIIKSYDVVITLFWQDMINTTTLKAIYDKLRAKILIYSPDMAPMTGGCFYFGNCLNFSKGCGKCPALDSCSKEDQSAINYRTKLDNYKRMDCSFLGNTWMIRFAKKSGLFKSVEKAEIIIDENQFKPKERFKSLHNLSIKQHDSFVIFLRSDSAPRKGNLDIAKAIRKFVNSLQDSMKSKIIVMYVGDDFFASLIEDLKCQKLSLGIVDLETLIDCYNSADLFINASYDDAGPSMINQSIMCGTPVVCYDNGAAIDVIINGISGFKTPTGNVNGLATGIEKVYNLTYQERECLAKTSRAVGLEHNSSKKVAMQILSYI